MPLTRSVQQLVKYYCDKKISYQGIPVENLTVPKVCSDRAKQGYDVEQYIEGQ